MFRISNFGFRIFLLAAALLLGSAPLYAQDAAEFRPVGIPVGPFTLTERSGQEVSRDDLRGKVWVAHFFYTTCPGPCTKTLPTMQKLQAAFKGRPDVRLVSITVNSAHDTLERLREYANDVGADPEQWLFLTGPETEVHETIRKSFFKGVERNAKPQSPGDDVTHSPDLLVIDREGQFVGYVDGTQPDSAEVVADKVREVARRRYWLPAVNAGLNGLCTLLLIAGYVAIRRRYENLHVACMVTALGVSALFLACYLYFHFVVLGGAPTRFRGEGWVRTAYFAILLTHTVLAMAVAPLALYVSYLGWRDRRPRHVRVARWTLPIWLYVSVTGVVVYWMLYHLYPPF